MKHRVFLYDNLRVGGDSHYKIKGRATLLSMGKMLSKQHVMIVGNGADRFKWPAVVECPGRGTYIDGEIYEVDDVVFEELKHFYGVPHYYNYDPVTVWTANTSSQAVIFHLPVATLPKATDYEVVIEGLWNRFESKPLHGSKRMTYDELWGDKEDDEKKWPDNFCNAGADDEDEEEPVCNNFTVEKGIYITNDMGDMWGPYDGIADAVAALPDLTEELRDSDVLTIGFRMIRQELSAEACDSIDNSTYAG